MRFNPTHAVFNFATTLNKANLENERSCIAPITLPITAPLAKVTNTSPQSWKNLITFFSPSTMTSNTSPDFLANSIIAGKASRTNRAAITCSSAPTSFNELPTSSLIFLNIICNLAPASSELPAISRATGKNSFPKLATNLLNISKPTVPSFKRFCKSSALSLFASANLTTAAGNLSPSCPESSSALTFPLLKI